MSTTAQDLYSELEAKAQQAPAGGSYPELEAKGAQQAASADPYSELEARAGGATIPAPAVSGGTQASFGAGHSILSALASPNAQDDAEADTAAVIRAGGLPLGRYASTATSDVGDFVRHEATGFGASVAAGGRIAWDALTGRIHSIAQADLLGRQTEGEYTAPTTTAGGATLSDAVAKMGGWLGYIPQKIGEGVDVGLHTFGVPSQYSTLAGGITEGAINLGLAAAPGGLLKGAGEAAEGAEAAAGGAKRAAQSAEGLAARSVEASAGNQSISAAATEGGALPQGAPPPESAPVAGGLPKEYQDARSAILSRVGLTTARDSAIEGNALDAASDFQMSRFDEPGGRSAATQFEAERNALTQHAENLIGQTGGTVGMDEEALAARGQTLATPFDRLRAYYDDSMREAYQTALSRSAGMPTTNLESLDTLLADPTFRNTLLAKDQGGLLTSVESQLEHFREGSPDGFTPAGAEQVRQFMNAIWSPQNQWAIGRMKDAIDEDVTQAAGEDIYGPARALRQQKAQVLEDPKGIAQLFSADPATSINRTTPFEKIPDKIMALPLQQFGNLIDTLHNMPEAIQPEAQAALGELRGHMVNRLLAAGSQTTSGAARGLWGADAVSRQLAMHGAKFRLAFADDPQALAGIQDLANAGQILKTNPAYPGAAAQAANALKRGLLTRAVTHVGGAIGAGVGGAIAGPLGSMGREMLGRAAGSSMSASAAERAAVRAWEKRTRTLTSPTPAQ